MDPATIKPSIRRQSDKFSWNVYQFMVKRPHSKVFSGPDVITGKALEFYVGGLDTDDGAPWFYGQSLIRIACGDKETYAYPPKLVRDFVDVTDFWERYQKVGRCIWDPGHTGWMQGGQDRFIFSGDGQTRTCQWCGAVQTLKIEVKMIEQRREWWVDTLDGRK